MDAIEAFALTKSIDIKFVKERRRSQQRQEIELLGGKILAGAAPAELKKTHEPESMELQ